MRTRAIGSTTVSVTELGFGAAPIANMYQAVTDVDAAASLADAWTGGIRYYDTAPHYGLGLSERRLATTISGWPRTEYALSTKVGRLLEANPHPSGSDLDAGGFDVPDNLHRVLDYSGAGVRCSIEASLERLGLDYIDIAYVHDPEDHMDAAIREAIPELIKMRAEGIVRAVGAGMNFVDPLQRIVTETDVDVIMVAGRYTLVDRSAEALLDDCLARGVAVVSAAPFNSGLLARAWPTDDAHFDYGPASAAIIAKARSFAQTCVDHCIELPQAALQFPLRHPAVVSTVTGLRTAAEVDDALRWVADPLPETFWTELLNQDR